MARKPALRAVEPGEKPAKVLTLEEAVATGDPLQIELAQRRDIVAKLKDAKGPAAAALHRQLSLTNDKIERLQAKADQEQKERGGAEVPDEPFDAATV